MNLKKNKKMLEIINLKFNLAANLKKKKSIQIMKNINSINNLLNSTTNIIISFNMNNKTKSLIMLKKIKIKILKMGEAILKQISKINLMFLKEEA